MVGNEKYKIMIKYIKTPINMYSVDGNTIIKKWAIDIIYARHSLSIEYSILYMKGGTHAFSSPNVVDTN